MKTEKGRDHRNQTQNRFSSLVAPVLIRSRFSSPFFFSLSVSLRQSSCFKAADGLQHWHRPSVNKWRKRGSETCSRFFLSSDRPIEKKKLNLFPPSPSRQKKKNANSLISAFAVSAAAVASKAGAIAKAGGGAGKAALGLLAGGGVAAAASTSSSSSSGAEAGAGGAGAPKTPAPRIPPAAAAAAAAARK